MLRAHLRTAPARRPADVALSLLTGRAALERRAVVVAADLQALDRGLADLSGPSVLHGSAPAEPGKLAFLFSGQGAQRVGMGSGLCGVFPVFAEAFEEVCAEFGRAGVVKLREVVSGAGDVDRTEFAQPGLFAVEVALFRLLESWGVRPDFVLGHSVGEVAAAHVAGCVPAGCLCDGRCARPVDAGSCPRAARWSRWRRPRTNCGRC